MNRSFLLSFHIESDSDSYPVMTGKLTTSSSFKTKESVSQSIHLEPHPLSSGGDLVILIRGLQSKPNYIWTKNAHTHTPDILVYRGPTISIL